MSWLSVGLPYPQNVYSFEDQAGVTRTPFFMGYRGQMQRWKDSWRTYQLEFRVQGYQLRALEGFFWVDSLSGGGITIGGQDGFGWVLMPLISESSLYPVTVNEDPPEQWVRIITPPVITAMGIGGSAPTGLFRATLTIETQYEGAEPAPA